MSQLLLSFVNRSTFVIILSFDHADVSPVEAGEFCELFLGEVPFGAQGADPFAEVLDQGAVEHSAQNYTYCMQRSTYNAYHCAEGG